MKKDYSPMTTNPPIPLTNTTTDKDMQQFYITALSIFALTILAVLLIYATRR